MVFSLNCMFSRCYCAKLNPLRYQYAPLFLSLLSFIRISTIRQASIEQLGTVCPFYSHQWSLNPSSLLSKLESQKIITILIIISLQGRNSPICSHIFLHPSSCNFISFQYFLKVGRFSPHFDDTEDSLFFIQSINWLIFLASNKDKSNVRKSHYIWW